MPHPAHHGRSRRLLLVLLETALILVAIAAAAYLRLGAGATEFLTGDEMPLRALIVVVVCQMCLHYCDLYDQARIAADRRDLIVRTLQALGATSIILALVYYFAPDMALGRGVAVIASALVVPLVIGWRLGFRWLSSQVGPRERLLLVGTNSAAVALARELHLRRDLGVEIVGFVDTDAHRVGQPVFNPGIVGTVDDIPAIVGERGIDKVVVSLADARGKLPMWRLLEMRTQGVRFEHLASVYEEYTGKIAIENLRPSWLIFNAGFERSPWRDAAKRAIDIAAALIGLFLLAPVIGLLAMLIRVTSPGPVFYRQQRVGQGGRVFTVVKLRSMRADAEQGTGAVWAR
ncbi:MAG: hypothetical protein FJW23_04020 [Acidimicrobiia bacterium]|nr:hypothetical protein [Acidimicrobiia bacterium]